MWNGKKVSIVFSTYNEKESIKQQINDCFTTGLVDEVIVINNNAAKGTNEEVKKTKAKLFHEPKQGYGHGYQRGLREATGDLIIMSEPDGTFDHTKDIQKLLVYSNDFPVVLGTRTTQALIGESANMGVFLKWGNFFVAKLIEVLFNTTHLSDAGCTLRLISKEALKKIQPHFTIGRSHFGPEMIILIALKNIPFVEIPIHYLKRIGQSSVTGSFSKALKLGIIMIGLIKSYRIKSLFKTF